MGKIKLRHLLAGIALVLGITSYSNVSYAAESEISTTINSSGQVTTVDLKGNPAVVTTEEGDDGNTYLVIYNDANYNGEIDEGETKYALNSDGDTEALYSYLTVYGVNEEDVTSPVYLTIKNVSLTSAYACYYSDVTLEDETATAVYFKVDGCSVGYQTGAIFSSSSSRSVITGNVEHQVVDTTFTGSGTQYGTFYAYVSGSVDVKFDNIISTSSSYMYLYGTYWTNAEGNVAVTMNDITAVTLQADGVYEYCNLGGNVDVSMTNITCSASCYAYGFNNSTAAGKLTIEMDNIKNTGSTSFYIYGVQNSGSRTIGSADIKISNMTSPYYSVGVYGVTNLYTPGDLNLEISNCTFTSTVSYYTYIYATTGSSSTIGGSATVKVTDSTAYYIYGLNYATVAEDVNVTFKDNSGLSSNNGVQAGIYSVTTEGNVTLDISGSKLANSIYGAYSCYAKGEGKAVKISMTDCSNIAYVYLTYGGYCYGSFDATAENVVTTSTGMFYGVYSTAVISGDANIVVNNCSSRYMLGWYGSSTGYTGEDLGITANVTMTNCWLQGTTLSSSGYIMVADTVYYNGDLNVYSSNNLAYYNTTCTYGSIAGDLTINVKDENVSTADNYDNYTDLACGYYHATYNVTVLGKTKVTVDNVNTASLCGAYQISAQDDIDVTIKNSSFAFTSSITYALYMYAFYGTTGAAAVNANVTISNCTFNTNDISTYVMETCVYKENAVVTFDNCTFTGDYFVNPNSNSSIASYTGSSKVIIGDDTYYGGWTTFNGTTSSSGNIYLGSYNTYCYSTTSSAVSKSIGYALVTVEDGAKVSAENIYLNNGSKVLLKGTLGTILAPQIATSDSLDTLGSIYVNNGSFVENTSAYFYYLLETEYLENGGVVSTSSTVTCPMDTENVYALEDSTVTYSAVANKGYTLDKEIFISNGETEGKEMTAGTTSGSYSFTMPSAETVAQFTFTGIQIVVAKTVSDPIATLNETYTEESPLYDLTTLTISKDGTVGTITYAISEGSSLPTGLSLTEDGLIIGTPTVATDGTDVYITVTGRNGTSAEICLTIVVSSDGTGTASNSGRLTIDADEKTIVLNGTSVVIEKVDDDTTAIYLDDNMDGTADSTSALYSADLTDWTIIGVTDTETTKQFKITMNSGTVGDIYGAYASEVSNTAVTNVVDIQINGGTVGAVYGLSSSTVTGGVRLYVSSDTTYTSGTLATSTSSYTGAYSNVAGDADIYGEYETDENIEATTLTVGGSSAKVVLNGTVTTTTRLSVTYGTSSAYNNVTFNGAVKTSTMYMRAYAYATFNDTLDIEDYLYMYAVPTYARVYIYGVANIGTITYSGNTASCYVYIEETGDLTLNYFKSSTICVYQYGKLTYTGTSATNTSIWYVYESATFGEEDNNYTIIPKMYFPAVLDTSNLMTGTLTISGTTSTLKTDKGNTFVMAGSSLSLKYTEVTGYTVYGYMNDNDLVQGEDGVVSLGTTPYGIMNLGITYVANSISASKTFADPTLIKGTEYTDESPAYNLAQLTITGDTTSSYGTDVVYSIRSGSLPDGLSLDTETGLITGTPTTVNTEGTKVTFKITGRNGTSTNVAVVFTVADTDYVPANVNDTVTVSGTSIYLNGTSVVIIESGDGTAIYLDEDMDGIADNGLALEIDGSTENDLSSYTVYGYADTTAEYDGSISITMHSGTVKAIYGVYGTSTSVTTTITGDITISIYGGAVKGNTAGVYYGEANDVTLYCTGGTYSGNVYGAAYSEVENINFAFRDDVSLSSSNNVSAAYIADARGDVSASLGISSSSAYLKDNYAVVTGGDVGGDLNVVIDGYHCIYKNYNNYFANSCTISGNVNVEFKQGQFGISSGYAGVLSQNCKVLGDITVLIATEGDCSGSMYASNYATNSYGNVYMKEYSSNTNSMTYLNEYYNAASSNYTENTGTYIDKKGAITISRTYVIEEDISGTTLTTADASDVTIAAGKTVTLSSYAYLGTSVSGTTTIFTLDKGANLTTGTFIYDRANTFVLGEGASVTVGTYLDTYNYTPSFTLGKNSSITTGTYFNNSSYVATVEMEENASINAGTSVTIYGSTIDISEGATVEAVGNITLTGTVDIAEGATVASTGTSGTIYLGKSTTYTATLTNYGEIDASYTISSYGTTTNYGTINCANNWYMYSNFDNYGVFNSTGAYTYVYTGYTFTNYGEYNEAGRTYVGKGTFINKGIATITGAFENNYVVENYGTMVATGIFTLSSNSSYKFTNYEGAELSTSGTVTICSYMYNYGDWTASGSVTIASSYGYITNNGNILLTDTATASFGTRYFENYGSFTCLNDTAAAVTVSGTTVYNFEGATFTVASYKHSSGYFYNLGTFIQTGSNLTISGGRICTASMLDTAVEITETTQKNYVAYLVTYEVDETCFEDEDPSITLTGASSSYYTKYNDMLFILPSRTNVTMTIGGAPVSGITVESVTYNYPGGVEAEMTLSSGKYTCTMPYGVTTLYINTAYDGDSTQITIDPTEDTVNGTVGVKTTSTAPLYDLTSKVTITGDIEDSDLAVTYTLVSGETLPAGLSLVSGKIYGTPTTIVSDYTVKVRIKGANQTSAVITLTFNIAKGTGSWTAPSLSYTVNLNSSLSDISLSTKYSWVDDSIVLSTAGTYKYEAYYYPTDTVNYDWTEAGAEELEDGTIVIKFTITVNVRQATPTYTTPTGVTAYYGDTLADVDLSAYDSLNDEGIPGKFSWYNEEASVGDVGETSFRAIFTPTDSTNYKTINYAYITVTVLPKAMTAEIVDTLEAEEGDTLADMVLPESDYGVYQWYTDRTTEVTNGGTYYLLFVPYDTTNYDWTGNTGWDSTYSRIEMKVTVTFVGHVHKYGDYVYGDDEADGHWRQCTNGEDCQNTTDQADHVMVLDADNSVAATCGADGYSTYTCSVCGYTKKVVVEATGEHTYVLQKYTEETCETEGSKEYKCSVCGDEKTDAVEKASHDYSVVKYDTTNHWTECSACGDVEEGSETAHTNVSAVTAEPTCTKEGQTTYTCTVCGATSTEAIAALGHTKVTDNAVAATCTETGLTAGSHCSVCNEVIVAQEVTAATGHTWDDGVTYKNSSCGQYIVYTCYACDETKTEDNGTSHTEATYADVAPSCTETGLTGGTYCSACGVTLTARTVVAATGHTAVTDEAVAATCTDPGSTEGSHCSTCGEIITAVEAVDALGHDWDYDNGVQSTTSSCGVVMTYTCKVCSETIDMGTELSAHTIVADDAVLPTCTETGLTAGSHCSVCKAVIEEQEVVAATGHTVVADEAVAATCTIAGKTAGSHCSTCGEVLVEQTTIAATGHTVITQPAEEPTCTEAGSTEGSYCSTCGTIFVAPEAIDALGHDWEDTETVSDSCDEAVIQTCKTCGETQKISTGSKAHTIVIDVAVPATCTESGLTEGSHCSVCEAIIVEQQTVSPTGHTEEADAAVEATCTTAGKTAGSHCSVCGTTIVAQEEIAALGHTPELVEGYAATCTSDGLTNGSKCSVCGDWIVLQETINALGHEGHVYSEPYTEGSYCSTVVKKKCTLCDYEEIVAESVGDHNAVAQDDAVEATCTSSGLTASYVCSECGVVVVEQTVISALGHTIATKAAVAPTCTETGLTEGTYCSVCNTTFTSQETVAATGHTIVTINATAATCTTAGKTAGSYCSVCNETLVEQKEVAALGHTSVTDEGNAATCTESGLTEGSHCSICGTTIVAQTIIQPLGHDYQVTNTDESTCGVTVTTYECGNCGDTIIKSDGTEGHANTEELDDAVAATCISTGLTATVVCSDCGAVITEQQVVDVIGHTEEELPGIDATCITTGLSSGLRCSVCGEVTQPQEDTDIVDHNYESRVTVVATTTSNGIIVYTCSMCGKSYKEVIPMIVVDTDEEEEEDDGTVKASDELIAEVITAVANGTYSVTEGTTLAGVTLPTSTYGSYAWAESTSTVAVSGTTYTIVFTPNEGSNVDWSDVDGYDASTGTVSISVTVTTTPSSSSSDNSGNSGNTDNGNSNSGNSGSSSSGTTNSGSSSGTTISAGDASATTGSTVTVGTTYTDEDGNVFKVTSVGETNTVTLVTGSKTATTVSIDTVVIDGVTFTVTEIADEAFKDNKNLTSIYIGDGIIKIGKKAFANCSKLTTVSGFKNVQTIGASAFSKCTKLVTVGNKKNVITLANVVTIANKAFFKCTSIKKVNATSKKLVSIGNSAFQGCKNLKTFISKSKVLKKIGKKAFFKCKKLATVKLKTKKLTSKNVLKKAFKGIKATCSFKVPKAKKADYKKLFKLRGAKSTIKVK